MNEINSLRTIEKNLDRMSLSDRKIAEYILNNHASLSANDKSIHTISDEINVSASTISRFIHKYCNKSFSSFKIELGQIQSSPEDAKAERSHELYSWDDPADIIGRKLSGNIADTFNDVLALNPTVNFEKASEFISEAHKIIFFGVGASGVTVSDFQNKLMRLEKPCIYNNDSNYGIINGRIASTEDVIVAISFSGKTKEVILPVEQAKGRGVRIITITGNRPNPLEKLADINLKVPVYGDDASTMVALYSRYAQQFICDMLFLCLANKSSDSVITFVEQYRQLLKKLKE